MYCICFSNSVFILTRCISFLSSIGERFESSFYWQEAFCQLVSTDVSYVELLIEEYFKFM